MLPKLRKYGIVTTSRLVRDGGLNRLVLFPIVSERIGGRALFRLVNRLLPSVSFLLFSIGVFLMRGSGMPDADDVSLAAAYALLFGCIALHEAGHLIAALAYGYDITETGLLLIWLFPIGAYVAHLQPEVGRRREMIQVSLAGIEGNLLVTGIMLTCAAMFPSASATLRFSSNLNMLIALANLLPMEELDGEEALSALCGVESIYNTALAAMRSKKRRAKMRRAGLPGYLCMGFFTAVLLSKAVFWLMAAASFVFSIWWSMQS